MTDGLNTARGLHAAREKLQLKLEAKEREHAAAERSITSWRGQAKLSRLAREIESLRQRLETTQRLIEANASEAW